MIFKKVNALSTPKDKVLRAHVQKTFALSELPTQYCSLNRLVFSDLQSLIRVITEAGEKSPAFFMHPELRSCSFNISFDDRTAGGSSVNALFAIRVFNQHKQENDRIESPKAVRISYSEIESPRTPLLLAGNQKNAILIVKR